MNTSFQTCFLCCLANAGAISNNQPFYQYKHKQNKYLNRVCIFWGNKKSAHSRDEQIRVNSGFQLSQMCSSRSGLSQSTAQLWIILWSGKCLECQLNGVRSKTFISWIRGCFRHRVQPKLFCPCSEDTLRFIFFFHLVILINNVIIATSIYYTIIICAKCFNTLPHSIFRIILGSEYSVLLPTANR